MIKSDTIIASLAFISFAIMNVCAFLFLARNITKLSISFCGLLTVSFLLWAMHGYAMGDIALSYGSGMATLTFGIILGLKIYNSKVMQKRKVFK